MHSVLWQEEENQQRHRIQIPPAHTQPHMRDRSHTHSPTRGTDVPLGRWGKLFSVSGYWTSSFILTQLEIYSVFAVSKVLLAPSADVSSFKFYNLLDIPIRIETCPHQVYLLSLPQPPPEFPIWDWLRWNTKLKILEKCVCVAFSGYFSLQKWL